MGSWSIWHWLVVLLVVVLVFGTKKLGNIGKDMGKAVKGFKDGIKEAGDDEAQKDVPPQQVTAQQTAVDPNATAANPASTIEVQAKDAQGTKES